MAVLHSSEHRFAGLFRGRPTIWLAAIALLPVVAISLLGRQYASHLQGIAPIDLTNFIAVRDMLHGVLRMSEQADSWLPMREALGVLHGDHADRLYETLFFGKTVRFQYPPTSLLPMELLSLLGLRGFDGLNRFNFAIYGLNAAGVGVVAWLLFHIRSAGQNGGPAQTDTRPDLDAAGVTALAVASAFLFYPLVRAQVLGQIQIWIDALFTLTIIFWLRDRRFLAGMCIGLACAIKPQMALLLIWGALWKQAAFSGGILVCIAPVGVISLLRYGLHNNLAYLDVLSFLSRHGESYFANNSINGILNGYFSPSNPHVWDASVFTPYVPIVYAGTTVAAVVAIGLIVAPALIWRGTGPSLECLGAAAICTVIGSPVAWEHHYGILLPIYLVALRAASALPAGTRRGVMLAAIALSWILVANLIPFTLLLANTPFSLAQAHCFFGALLLLLVLLTLQHHAQPQLRLKFSAG
jgi:alpha-1,2-mannosyltransferase